MFRRTLFLAVGSIILQAACAGYARTKSLSRRLQIDEKWWAIQDPDFRYENSQFSFTWRTSDYIPDAHATFTVYDGHNCKEGNTDITESMTNHRDILTGAYLQNLGIQPDSNTRYDPNNPNLGDGFRDFRAFMDVQPTLANTDLLYYTEDNQLKAVVDFCVRFSLYNADHRASDAIEVNFQETLVTFYVDLTDGFDVGNVLVEDKAKLERTAFLDCEIIAYECDDDKQPLAEPGFLRNQGDETRVCVELAQESKDQGLYLDRVFWFYFIREDPREVKQWSIVMDSLSSPDQLTDYGCMRGEEICAFNTILRADYYAWQGVGVVRGIGEGLCALGGPSWLVEDRSRTLGGDLFWIHHDTPLGSVNRISLNGFPVGASIEYTDTDGTLVSSVVEDDSFIIVIGSGDPLSNDEEATIRASLDTLSVQAPLHSDVNFVVDMIVQVGDGDHRYERAIQVYAVADPPTVSATESLALEEDGAPIQLQVFADRSADEDNSETLSVRITVPGDSSGPIGTIIETSPSSSVTLTASQGGRLYLVEASGPDPAAREANLDAYTASSLAFQPRANYAGHNTLTVEAVSTEAGDVAFPNSIAHETLGDFDTRTEVAETLVPITVTPVVDLPYMTSDQSVVAENNLDSNSDQELLVKIGELMGVKVDDLDGSQTLEARLTGFPTNSIDLSFAQSRENVTTTVDQGRGTVTIGGDNVEDVLLVLSSLEVILANDDDTNFQIEMVGNATDTDGVDLLLVEEFYIIHTVIVQAVADAPTLDVGLQLKAIETESTATFTAYPVTVGLNDKDGTETFLGRSVNITLSTPTGVATGAEPVVSFSVLPEGVVVTSTPGNPAQYIVQGTTEDVTIAMNNLMIRPGDQNGEDITVTVTAAAVESDPTEQGPGEVAILEVRKIETFVIPVDPVIQGEPVLTVNAPTASGDEDTTISLGVVGVDLQGTADQDGSEVYYLDIDTTSFPTRTKFYVNNAEQKGNVLDDGWLRLNEFSGSNSFKLRPPPNFSGEISLSLRAHIIDYTMSGIAEKTTAPRPLSIEVFPIADDIVKPTGKTVGVEDLGPVPFGSTLVNTGLKPKDRGNGAGNNPETETFSEILVQVPEDGSITYTMSGDFDGVGSAKVSFDESTRSYTISSTILSGDLSALSLKQRTDASTDILDTLETFEVEMGPAHSDENGQLSISMTTLDVNVGQSSTKTVTFTHDIIIQAVADTPSILVYAAATTDEDGAPIPLKIEVGASDDLDGSEETFLRIIVPLDADKVPGTISALTTVPSGVTLSEPIDNIFVVRSEGSTVEERLSLLNSFVNDESGQGLQFVPSENWSGRVTLTCQVISVESATGDELAPDEYGGEDGTSRTETVTDYLDVTVIPKADTPTITIKSNSKGLEDTKIAVPVGVTVKDNDGSETFVLEIAANLPEGAKIFGAGDTELQAAPSGKFVLKPADVDALHILPPLHWSSAVQGDIELTITAVVTDTSNTGAFDISISASQIVPVVSIGVADKAKSRTVIVEAVEDQDYPIGKFFGDLDTGVLVDTDGSETLSFMIGGFPDGILAKTDNGEGISYVGNGSWQIDKEAIPSLRVTSLKNFAGMNPYDGMFVRAITQEIEGNQAVSDDWPITIKVQPVADSIDWSMSVSLTEEDHDVRAAGVSFSSALNFTMLDTDGSESVKEFYVDLSSFIEDAQVGQRLNDLTGGSTLDDLISGNLIEGSYSYDAPTGVLTVASNAISSLKLKASLFLDSNIDFAVPISAKIVDTVTIDNASVSDSIVQDGSLSVELKGTADVPTIFVDSEITGHLRIPISLGGKSTDTDVALGRVLSERIHYFIEGIDMDQISAFQFVDSSNAPVGFDGGENTWFLYPEDVAAAEASGGLFFAVQNATSTTATATFELTSVATENDGDVAMTKLPFQVQFSWEGTLSAIPPLAPIVTIGTNEGLEDEELALDITAQADPDDPSNPAISIVFKSNSFPTGSALNGTFLPNLKTGHFVARAQDVQDGNVHFVPPTDFGGDLDITIEVLAVNGSFRSATSGLVTVPLYFDPVADGLGISLPSTQSDENKRIALNFSFSAQDVDGSEQPGGSVYIKLCDRASFVESFAQVSSGDSDATIVDVSTVGYRRIPRAKAGNLQVQPDLYWHGDCVIDVIAYSEETEDDQDADYRKVAMNEFTITVLAVPTPAILTAPAGVTVDENNYVAFAPDFSAQLVDQNPENGFETLSVFVSNVPENSLFNMGSNTGNGIWSLPNDSNTLSGLEFRAPMYFSGTITLVFSAITRESSDALAEAEVTAETIVTVNPVASPFLIVAENINVAQNGSGDLVLAVRMDDNVKLPGETALEVVKLTFSSVPTTVSLTAKGGGSINDKSSGSGIWIFEGTEDQSNALALSVAGNTSPGDYNIQISGVTKDGNKVLDPPITDTFRLRVLQATPARHLQPLDDVFIDDLPPDLKEGCADAIKVVGDDATRVKGDMFTLLDQGDQTLSYRFAPNFAATDNYYAVLYPEAPVGQTSCPVLFQGDTALILTANCYANEVTFYVFVNSKQGSASSALIPTTCDNLSIADREGGTSRVYQVTLPCSRCTPEELLLRRAERHLVQTPNAAAPRLHKALAASLKHRNHRDLQQLENANSQFEFEIQMDVVGGAPRNSAGSTHQSKGFLVAAISTSLLLWHLHW